MEWVCGINQSSCVGGHNVSPERTHPTHGLTPTGWGGMMEPTNNAFGGINGWIDRLDAVDDVDGRTDGPFEWTTLLGMDVVDRSSC